MCHTNKCRFQSVCRTFADQTHVKTKQHARKSSLKAGAEAWTAGDGDDDDAKRKSSVMQQLERLHENEVSEVCGSTHGHDEASVLTETIRLGTCREGDEQRAGEETPAGGGNMN